MQTLTFLQLKTFAQRFGRLEVNAALKDPKVRQRMHELGAVIAGGTPQEFHDYLVADQKRWAHVIQAAGIKME